MNKDLRILIILILTPVIMFATSLLLDLQIFQKQFVRQLIVYAVILLQLFLAFILIKFQIKK